MDLLFMMLFYTGFAVVIFCVFADTLIVNSRLARIRDIELPLVFSMKGHLERLEGYKHEYGNGEEDLWYKILKTVRLHGLKWVGVTLVVGFLAVII